MVCGVEVIVPTTAPFVIELIHKIERLNPGWSVLDRKGDDSGAHGFQLWMSTAATSNAALKVYFLSLTSFPYFTRVTRKATTIITITERTYAFEFIHCVLCNRINTLDPLHLCTGMKCIQKDASMKQKCQHYLLCTSIIIMIIMSSSSSSFVNESYLVLCLARTLYDYVCIWPTEWNDEFVFVRANLLCLVTFICIKQSAHSHTHTNTKCPFFEDGNNKYNSIAMKRVLLYLFNKITGNSLRTKKDKKVFCFTSIFQFFCRS